MHKSLLVVCTVLSLGSWTQAARAESPRFFELEGFSRFVDNNPESTAITEEGAIGLPPGVRERFGDPAMAFGTACAQGDNIIVSRVEDGGIVSIDPKGKLRELHKVPEAMVTAMLCDVDAVYIAVASPAAKIYRLDNKGRVDTFYTPDASFVWDLTRGPKGHMFVATGEPGTVVDVDTKGKGTTVFKAEQTHLKSLAYDSKLGLFVGGGERGVVYQSADLKTFRALYDTGTAEITALLVREPYVFASGVTGAAALVGSESTEPAAQTAGKKGKGASDVRSQLVRIGVDGTSDILAGSGDEAVFAMAFDARGQVIVATGATGREDPRGRLYSIDPDNKLISMLYQSPSRRLTHLVRLPKGDLAAIANGSARIVDLTHQLAKTGEFLTQAFDTGINSTYGLVQILGTWPKGTGAELSVRSGQTQEPDATWSSWTQGIAAPGDKSVKVPPGRFVQAKLTLRGNGEATPLVHRLRVAYLRQNVAPFVREVTVLRKGLSLSAVPKDETKVKLVAVSDKGDDQTTPEAPLAHAPPRARQAQEPGAITIKWQSDDPNGDELVYDLFVRGADQTQWRLLKGELEDPFYTLKSSQLPDGYYYFRVRASDARSNPDGLDRSDMRDSRALLIDNTAPIMSALKVSVQKRAVTILGHVEDAFGPLVELSYALDGQRPRPIAPEDGLLDGPNEQFTINLKELAPGHHTLTVRAGDEADNQGVAEAQFDVR